MSKVRTICDEPSATASRLIDGYGNEAATHAARKALALVASGDTEGYLMWLRILQAVDGMLEDEKTLVA